MKIFRQIPLLLVFCCFFAGLSAQHPASPAGDYRIFLNNRVLPAGLFLELPFFQIGPDHRGPEAGTWFIAQFDHVPTQAERAHIESGGLKMLDYLPNYAWVIYAPTRYYSFAPGIPYRIINVQPEWKIRQSLIDRPLPPWAVKVPGKVDVVATFYSNVAATDAKALIADKGWEMLEANEYGNYYKIRIADDQVNQVAALEQVSFVEPVTPDPQPENYSARTQHRSNAIATDYGAGRHYSGQGVVVAMGDDGPIGPHIDYTGRVDNSRVSTNTGNHGDHVGGTIMGAGNLDPTTRGMAFGANLEVYSVWDAVNESPVDHIADSVVITSTSYSDGCNAGYTSFARTADQITRQNPKLIHVFSAGNDGTSDCGYGAGANWGNITGGVKIGKNVITVGNLTETEGIAASSSRGPAHDGRIKPEVCAKGTDVTSTIDENTYASFTGTSMACPGTSGTMAQINGAYRALNGGQLPPSGLIKALLMNTAEDLGNPGPDYKYGYGRINALKTVRCLEQQTYFIDSISQGETDSFTISVPANTAQLRVMAYWHDREAANMASVALVNNLQLSVEDPSATSWNPWILDPTPTVAALNSNAVRGNDNLNNQEQVTLDAPAAGDYTVRVGTVLVPQGPQTYFLVYEIVDSSITVTYPIGGEGLRPNEQEVIRWDTWGNYGTFTIEYSLDSGSTWLPVANNVAGARRHQSWTVPNSLTGKALIRVTRGSQSGQSASAFSIMSVPTGLQVFRACPGSVTLKWNPISTAVGYDVFKLGAMYMDSLGTTTADTFVINGLNQFDEYWFAVRALGPDDARGRRCIAINKNPGIWNCLDPNDVAVDQVLVPPAGIVLNCAFPSSVQVKIELKNYSPNAVTNIPVSYKINNNAVVTETFTGTLPGFGTAEHTFAPTETFAGGTTTITSWAGYAPDVNTVNDTTTSLSQFVAGAVVTLPYAQNFETFTNCTTSSNCDAGICALTANWTNAANNSVDDIDWRTNSGTTPTTNSGPDEDHNPGTSAGKYLYLEASNCFGNEGYLLSPCVDLTGATAPELSFWMHLFGAEMGELHVDIFADGGWTNDVIPMMSTNWSNVWWLRTVNLTPWVGKTIVIRWRGITGAGPTSDMALDDISISEPAEVVKGNSGNAQFSVYPVPGDGLFTLEMKTEETTGFNIRVTDLQGRWFFETFENVNGAFRTSLDLRHLPAGVYLLNISGETGTWTRRLVIQ